MAAALIAEVYAKRREEIATLVAGQLKSSNAPHYQSMSLSDLADRGRRLVDCFIDSMAGEPGRLAAYVEEIADARQRDGFLLGEILGVIKVLEETVWRMTLDRIPDEYQIEALSRLTTAIGAAKDRLARVYLERSLRAETEATRLRHRVDDLRNGKDAPAVDETERE